MQKDHTKKKVQSSENKYKNLLLLQIRAILFITQHKQGPPANYIKQFEKNSIYQKILLLFW